MSSIEFFFEDIKPFKTTFDDLKNHINYLIENELKQTGDISVIFCSDQYLLKINEQYLAHDYYTDIITFNYVEGTVISGDLFISADRVKENAGIYNAGFLQELYRVVFHGVLHLIGLNDETPEEKEIMREKENFYLDKFDFSREKK